MFESAELGHKIPKETYEKEVPALREKLLDVQYDLLEKGSFSVVIIIGGVDGAGKGETVNTLYEWMDPRHLTTNAIETPTQDEAERPYMYRFWQRLPPVGKISMFLGSWYTDPIVDRTYGRIKGADLDRSMEEIARFERMLTNERVLVLKFWLHVSKRDQKKRLTKLARDPRTAWRVTPTDWEHFEMYNRFRRISERALRESSTGEAPWYVIESSNDEYRKLSIGSIIHDAIRKRLDDPVMNAVVHAPPLVRSMDGVHVLNALDLDKKIDKATYDADLEKYQGKLNLMLRSTKFQRRNIVAVFEGSDAAGKGGAIRRITGALDARQYRVIPIAAPTDEEKARPYLWRFWRNVPRKGKVAIFDRSWYGRVLVERIEGYCDEDDWMRAYGEINDFEESMRHSGAIVMKFWLQISPEEQLRRFEERSKTAFKRFKITEDDWRNRDKWDAYQLAAAQMIDRTSTDSAPWTIVEANDKRYSRIKILRTLCEKVEAHL
ncbi:MAG: polyphosphate:AMP phosphotransferase [Polyangiaceae bacterium]|nr:polyphosphate:AMP phosphotransferase [Polyangiaceae bacterium]